jgi:IrrE N-terminal-like domain
MRSRSQIEHEARMLLAEMEQHADLIWPNTQPDRLYMCDPEAACRLLGLECLREPHLGSYGDTGTAGMLDRKRGVILLSTKQRFEGLRFTAAHEVGHYLLHPGEVMFRDRSLSDHGGPGRLPTEREADWFAASFLAPPKLVQKAFRARFQGHEPLTNTGATCFMLSASNASYLESLPANSLEFALAVARAERFGGYSFKSLTSLFGVSPTTMALRLMELGLVC